jgi:hypothetical protein
MPVRETFTEVESTRNGLYEASFIRFQSLVNMFSSTLDKVGKTLKAPITRAVLTGLARVVRQGVVFGLVRPEDKSPIRTKVATAFTGLFDKLLLPLFTRAIDMSKEDYLKSAALSLMATIMLVGRRAHFDAQFPTFFTKRVVTHIGDSKKTPRYGVRRGYAA